MIKLSNGWHALSVLVTLFVTEQAVAGVLLSRKDNSLTRAAQTILFVDDADILYRSGTERILHPAKRASSNPIIRQDRPWEAAIGWMAVHRNPATGVYQIWYQAYAGVRAKRRSDRCVVCYAESRDGIHFTKPNLTLFPL